MPPPSGGERRNDDEQKNRRPEMSERFRAYVITEKPPETWANPRERCRELMAACDCVIGPNGRAPDEGSMVRVIALFESDKIALLERCAS